MPTDKKVTTWFVDNPISLDPGDLFYAVENTGTTPASGAIKAGQVLRDHYKIVVTVASNNLTVAIKHLDGSDPSADRPLYFKIHETIYALTAALSVTKNAGTNWGNAGGSAMAAKEIDWCVYIGRNATDGLTIAFSRKFGARIYSDFSTTSTNELYAGISVITNAAASDPYEMIGRFAATLSAGAGYTWTVPTYTALNLVHRRIEESRWLNFNFVPTNIALGASGVAVMRYRVTPGYIDYECQIKLAGAGLSVGSTPYWVLPFAATLSGASMVLNGVGNLLEATVASTAGQPLYNLIGGEPRLYPVAMTSSGTYVGQAFLTALIPFTWGADDEIQFVGQYPY